VPTYIYRFLDSDDTVEVQQAFTDSALTEAVNPADGLVHPVKKVFTPVGITFKGDGFYKTDNRGKSSKSSTSAATTPTPSTDSSSSGSSSSESSSAPASTSSSETSSSTTKTTSSHGDHSH
jgi:predicted nucleic acid-binding Zn ribbon protein